VEDFYELLLLAGKENGFGAQKLLRVWYERTATGAYLTQYTDEVAASLNYHKLMETMIEQDGSKSFSENYGSGNVASFAIKAEALEVL
jgi:hypothetical protein